MRLIDADKFEAYSADGTAFEGEEFLAYLSGMQRVLEDIDAAPTIDPGSTASRWIPVTERLPEDDIPQGRKMVTVFVCSEARRVQIASRVYWPEKDEWRWSKMMNNYVAHWMPLPEPPEVIE